MAGKLMSDKNKGFGRNLSWRNSNRCLWIRGGTEANNEKLKPGFAGIQSEIRTWWYTANTSADHFR